MKRFLLVLCFLFLSCSLSGCGNEENPSETSENPVNDGVVTESPEKNEDSLDDTSNNTDGGVKNSGVQSVVNGANDSKPSENSDGGTSSSDDDSVVEGKFPDGGSYKIRKSTDEIVMESFLDDSTCIIKYEFNGEKISNVSTVLHYNDEETAKDSYEKLKNDEFVKSVYKDVSLNGSEISYAMVDSYLDELKQKNKDEIFKELKDVVSKSDD